ncbi:peptidylprolyl isomerase [Candidatus Cardinium hertigii]|jgi:peptidyl-prolyl cis-trans isomerase SurA|uniref:PpiC domain-containing protein n=1 Tax=Candidatus Cardinium hertigii TaxID=247481 RepID=A0A3N2QCZ2_9BACT|nr:peptidylprolyl isomerase [Candidatus Cardinium hertigii]ROT47658.1 hypothetical protein EDM02_01290 [Candidatus Cardinium hertigii]
MLKTIIPALSRLTKKAIQYIFILFFCRLPVASTNGAPLLLDKVIATVDQELILHSELEEICKQLALEGKVVDTSVKMKLLRELVLNKIFLAKAALNNVKISKPQKALMQRECDFKIAYWVQRMGSEKKLTEHFHQSIYNIKRELKRNKKAQYLAVSVQQNLTQHVVVTPAEVKAYFDSLPSHKRLYYPDSFEIRQLVIYPKVVPARKEEAKEKLLRLKKLLVDGNVTFSELAKKYSDDAESAARGGEIDWAPLGLFDPAYEAAALALKVGEISDPIETKFGLHLIELIDRNKDQYRTRHILQMVQPTHEEIALAQVTLAQIREKIINKTLTIEEAIDKYSEDPETRLEGGLITANNQGGGMPSVLLSAEELPQEVYFAIDGLQEGEISQPQYMGTHHQSGWRLLYIKQKIEAHLMNLTQDYEKIHLHLLQVKKEEAIRKWIQTAKSEFVINFASEYQAVEQLL